MENNKVKEENNFIELIECTVSDCKLILETLLRADLCICQSKESFDHEETILMMGENDDIMLEETINYLRDAFQPLGSRSNPDFLKGYYLIDKSISLLNVYSLSKKKVNAKYFKDLDTTALIVVEKLEEVKKQLETKIKKSKEEGVLV